MSEEVLVGGVGNAGRVVRVGDTVRRPWHPSTPGTQALLKHLDTVLPGVAPVPLGRDEQGREVLSWVDGDVAVPPFPPWAAGEGFLVSVAELMRRIHDALEGWQPPADAVWSQEISDPHGGPIIAHADICPDNVVAREGRAVAVLDWEFAAPGRRIWDVVSAARLCVPFTAPSRRDPAYVGLDVTARLNSFVDAYRLPTADRAIFTDVLEERRLAGEGFVRRRIARREKAFVEKWDNAEGAERLRAEKDWIDAVPADVARSQPPNELNRPV